MEDLTVPQIFKIGEYLIYFWINENDPLEPVHVHVARGKPTKNRSAIPERQLRIIMQVVSARHAEIATKWLETFGEIRYYC